MPVPYKITDLAAAAVPLAGTELVEVVQSGVNKKATVAQVLASPSSSYLPVTSPRVPSALPLPVAEGGHGTTTATAARAALGPWGDAVFTPQGATAQRALSTKASERLSVRDFGAIGDDVADDTAAIQAAITYAQNLSSPNGGLVYFPAGTYRISAAITINATQGIIIEGMGGRTVLKQMGANLSVFEIGNDVAEQRHVLIRDIMLLSNAANTSPAILAYLLVRSQFEHVIISPQEIGSNHFATGLDLRGVDYVQITNCQIRATAYGIQARSRADNTFGTALYIDGGTKISEMGAGTGVRIHGGLGGVMFGNCDILVATNGITIENSIAHANREIFFSDECTIDTCSGYGVVVNNGCVTHLTFDGTWIGTCGGGIYHDDASSITKISDCHIVNIQGGGAGIVLARAGNNVVISGCRMNGTAGTAIHVLAASSSLTIEGNTIQTWINGIILPAGVSAFMIADNNINNVTATITCGTTPNGREKTIRDNIGFVSENSGTATVAAGVNATVTVNHGLAGTPTTVHLTPVNDLTPATHLVADTFTNTTFRILIPAGPSTAPNVGVSWRAMLYSGA